MFAQPLHLLAVKQTTVVAVTVGFFSCVGTYIPKEYMQQVYVHMGLYS
jgi:hypothetical protein